MIKGIPPSNGQWAQAHSRKKYSSVAPLSLSLSNSSTDWHKQWHYITYNSMMCVHRPTLLAIFQPHFSSPFARSWKKLIIVDARLKALDTSLTNYKVLVKCFNQEVWHVGVLCTRPTYLCDFMELLNSIVSIDIRYWSQDFYSEKKETT